ncbi:MAG: hypothetical protein GVY12_16875 [Bacteroidetes bacterium]|jgi:hypothetical protein|nr:hypothetical protein [Bacteroidota bacterium]
MNAFAHITRVGLVTLLVVLGLLVADTSRAQLQADTDRAAGAAVPAPDTISTDQERALVDLLGTSFQSLAAKSRRGRRIGGYALLGLGIGSGVGGAATLAFGEGDDARVVGLSLLGGGALLSGLSLLPFKLRGESERIYAAFHQMPTATPAQIRRKYVYWDRRFEEFALKQRQERIIGGVSSIAVGVATGLIVAQGTDQDDPGAVLWSALGPVLGGVTSLLVKSEAERRYETYRRAKEDIVGPPSATAIRVGMAPLPTGGVVGVVQVRF